MKIFLDTANLEQIQTVADWGILDGVTTNPTLISKENEEFEPLVKKILEIVPGPVSLECVESQAGAIVEEARGLAQLGDNVVVKIPIDLEGMKAIRILSEEGIQVNTTLIFSPTQALLAAKAGAAYLSPFVGRLDDISHDGMELVSQIMAVIQNYGFDSEVIVASIRHPRHVVEAAMMGADIATMPFDSLRKMVRHPLTDSGIERFLKDWEKVKSR
ncbi:MAG: fructose-6-phosphate aldolase [Candidatus Aminicenantes bacterium]